MRADARRDRAALTGRKQDAGSVVRIPASEIENRVARAVSSFFVAGVMVFSLPPPTWRFSPSACGYPATENAASPKRRDNAFTPGTVEIAKAASIWRPLARRRTSWRGRERASSANCSTDAGRNVAGDGLSGRGLFAFVRRRFVSNPSACRLPPMKLHP